MPGAEPPVLVLCPLDQTQSVIQSATVVSNSPPIFCICFDKQLCRNPTSSGQAFWVRQDGYLLHLRGLYTHRPIPSLCQQCFHCSYYCCCCYCCPRLEAFLDAPCASLVIPVVRRLHQSFRFLGPNKPCFFSSGGGSSGGGAGGGGNAEPLLLLLPSLVVTSCRWRWRLISFALWAMSLALRLLHTRFLGCLSKAIAGSLQSLVAFGGRHQHCFHAGTTLF